MKIKEAIEWLNGCIVSEEYEKGKPNGNITCDLTREVLNIAISALKKQVGKKPFWNGAFYECPNCNTSFGDDGERPMYCDICGQKIKWEG